MNKYSKLFLALGFTILAVALGSWFIYPEWRNIPAGIIGVIIVALGGTLVIIKNGTDIFVSYNKLRKPEKAWEKSPFEKTSPEIIRGDMGLGGQVSFINRGATDANLLWEHPKVIITGPMKAGKTREAAEVIQRAIDDDLVPKDQIYEPSQTFRALERSELEEALKWELDAGKKALLFIDDLPKQVLPGSEKKWDALFKALACCPEYYVVATARSDQLSLEQRKWLEDEHKFNLLELPGLSDEDVEKFVLAAGGVFGLQLSEEARKAFVEKSDGRPETTLIGLRRLANRGISEVNEEIASEIAKDGLELAWKKTINYLEEEYGGVKYWLDAIATFHSANVSPEREMVLALAKEKWKTQKKWKWKRNQLLQDAFAKLGKYDLQIREGIIRYPEVLVEGRILKDNAKNALMEFLVNYQRIWCWPLLRKINHKKERHAWALFELATGMNGSQAIELYDAAAKRMPHNFFYNNRGTEYADLGQHERAIEDFDKAIELNPEYAAVYYNRGIEYTALGQHERAIEDYDKAIELNPEFAAAYSNRGIRYSALGQRERAIEDYDKAIELNPKDATAYYNKACCYALCGEIIKAIEWLRIALSMDSTHYCGLVKEDHDFDGIRETKEFEDLIEEFCKDK